MILHSCDFKDCQNVVAAKVGKAFHPMPLRVIVKVLFEGKAVEGAVVLVEAGENNPHTLSLMTDHEGRAEGTTARIDPSTPAEKWRYETEGGQVGEDILTFCPEHADAAKQQGFVNLSERARGILRERAAARMRIARATRGHAR